MPLKDVLLTMINRKGLTLTLELRNYMKTSHPGEPISKPGYLKPRMKLNPDAFLDLYHFHNKNFYSEPGYSTWNGFLILAADGSDINIPTTDETWERFGSGSRKNTKPKGIYFLVRLKSSDYKKEQQNLEKDDSIVEIVLDKTGIRHYEGTPDGEHMKELGKISLRLVRVRLENGDYEILATNLPCEVFPTAEIGELYHMRWGIETAYETLKSRLQPENFTGTKEQLLLQDIYSTIYVSNLAEDIIHDVEAELDEKEQHTKKWP